jgi:hypothetical protein
VSRINTNVYTAAGKTPGQKRLLPNPDKWAIREGLHAKEFEPYEQRG